MKLILINGPNLNLLGIREKEIYGLESFTNYFARLQDQFKEHQLECYQSNIEGELINKLHEVGFSYDGIILNAGGYTHTSVAIADAISAITSPVIEVHISNIFNREEFRQRSLLSKHCLGIITGFGLESYTLAVTYFIESQKK